MSYTIEITRHVVSYRTRTGVSPPGGPCGGEWLDGDFRTIEPPSTTHESYGGWGADEVPT
ncbi:hypothetical protein [Streptomyces sp. NPDC057253]|uniref:hypothetical protein n=1 Tax=Streptomyces sp. NPDC057253 TaxID=3346069 RepID=UPI00362963A3